MKVAGPYLLTCLLSLPILAQSWRGDIETVLNDQVAAWNAGELEKFMDGYWNSDQLTFYSGDQPQLGYQAALERYRRRYQGEGREMGRLGFADLKYERLAGDVVFVRGRYLLTLSDGEATGLFTLIFRRFPEGWKIIHDHTSSGQ